VVDNELVAAVWPKRRLYSACNSSAGIDVANDGAIFCIVAVALSAIMSDSLRYPVTHFWYPGLKSPLFGALGIAKDIFVTVCAPLPQSVLRLSSKFSLSLWI
jgi:hypothetical protein